jgi:hypothetical protein
MLLATAAVGPTCADASASVQRAGAAKAAPPGRHLNAHQRAQLRRSLNRQLRKNPGVVLNRSFLKQAALADFKLPMSVRLNRPDGQGGYEPSDDQLEITWDDSVFAWPLAGGVPAPPQTVPLGGRFTMEASWNSDTSGTGELGAMETTQGLGLAMTASPFTISNFATTCGTGPQLVADPAANVAISSTGSRYGLLNMFAQTIAGSLSLRMTFAAQATPSCGSAPAPPQVVDNSAALPMPVRFAGGFKVSPAITADGKLRFGRITVDDAVTPQSSTFAYVRSCTGTVTCDPMQFPARLKIKKLTAEVLLGDIGP